MPTSAALIAAPRSPTSLPRNSSTLGVAMLRTSGRVVPMSAGSTQSRPYDGLAGAMPRSRAARGTARGSRGEAAGQDRRRARRTARSARAGRRARPAASDRTAGRSAARARTGPSVPAIAGQSRAQPTSASRLARSSPNGSQPSASASARGATRRATAEPDGDPLLHAHGSTTTSRSDGTGRRSAARAAERGAERADRVLVHRAAPVETGAEHPELLLERAHADAEHEAAVRDPVERAVPLRDREGVVVAEHEHVRDEAQPLGLRRQEAERRERIVVARAARRGGGRRDDDVLAARHVVEANRSAARAIAATSAGPACSVHGASCSGWRVRTGVTSP